MVLARWRQYARHLNMFSWAHPSPQSKRILISSAIFAQLTAVSSGMAGHVLSPKNYTFTQGQSGPLSNMWFLCQPESKSQTTSHSVQPFLHSSRQRLVILYNGTPLSPVKIVHSHWGSGPQSNTWFPGPT